MNQEKGMEIKKDNKKSHLLMHLLRLKDLTFHL
jgi:hypothetical protein